MSTTQQKVTSAELATSASARLGISAPHKVSQRRVQAFAAANEDHQWIHVDPARASTGPFGVSQVCARPPPKWAATVACRW